MQAALRLQTICRKICQTSWLVFMSYEISVWGCDKLPTEKLAIVLHALAIQSVEHGMAGPVSCTGASVCLPALSEIQGLAAKSSLVYFALICARERQPIVLQLYDSLWRLSTHILDGVLRSDIIFVSPAGWHCQQGAVASLWQKVAPCGIPCCDASVSQVNTLECFFKEACQTGHPGMGVLMRATSESQ